jgi:Dyp-type peroxidase family
MEKVEWQDVQGLLTSGYRKLPFSAYVVWHFLPDSTDAARRWLADLADRLMRADDIMAEPDSDGASQLPPTSFRALHAAQGSDRKAINLALTADGLRHLDIGERQLSEFSFEFLEGMAPKPVSSGQIPRRSNLLGDAGDSSPSHWQWGGWGSCTEVHGLLLLYAADAIDLQVLIQAELGAMDGVANVVLTANGGNERPVIINGNLQKDRKEHFGFADGISQPMIEGSPRIKPATTESAAPHRKKLSEKDQRIAVVKPGEFILGYMNERRERISSTSAKGQSGKTDLLRNGTYLVFRQLEQDVDAFENFVAELAKRMHGRDDLETRDEVAARMIGRYRSGKPLVPPAAGEESALDRNDFLYAYEDGAGMACPIGAHIRRANPRDAIGSDPDTALKLSKMHRIIRRGRTYGDRRDTQRKNSVGDTRGTAFIALNADIAGQFEMIQHSWLNNPQFGGLPVGTDPIGHVAHPGDEIVIQQRPFNLHIQRPRPFVTVRGGAYFFMPGVNAVRALADAGSDHGGRSTMPHQHDRPVQLTDSGN